MSDPVEDERTGWWRRRWGPAQARSYFLRIRSKLILRTLIALAVIIVIWPYVTIVIPAGKVGVLFRPLVGGTSVSRPMTEGLNLYLPWNQITLYDTRIQVGKTQFEAVTKEGLHLRIGVVYRYRVHASKVGRLHKVIGPNFTHILLEPAINSIVRMETARYSADQIYGDARSQLQQRIYSGVTDPNNRNMIEGSSDPSSTDMVFGRPALLSLKNSSPQGYVPLVELVDIQITEVRLPDRVREAIEKKEEQQQAQLEYTFRIEREKLESERKRVEAQGIRDFQQTVQAGISENYLRWRGIEATLRLATSPNSKTVIIGGGRTGMPLILNTDDSRSPAPANPRRGNNEKARSVDNSAANDSMDLTGDSTQGTLDGQESPKKPASPKKSQ